MEEDWLAMLMGTMAFLIVIYRVITIGIPLAKTGHVFKAITQLV